MAASLFATVFPSDCRFCGAPLVQLLRIPVCDACLRTVDRYRGEVCAVCGDGIVSAFEASDGKRICGECLKTEPFFDRALAYGAYDGALRELIHLLKYDRVKPAASVLGRMLSEVLLELSPDFDGRPCLVIPIPLHTGRMRERGFNQSELIARTALKLIPVGQLTPNLMERRRATESQAGLSRARRQRNVRGAFVLPKPAEVCGRDIVLVDDVLTTGTTISECARILKKAGASRVYAATIARAMLVTTTGAGINRDDTENASVEIKTGPFAQAARIGL